ncbi:MAG TPA: hypothetical protein PK299_05010 [Anaerolineales bacterium]|nr:hypothetical protein [Anaerolineales bacterium]
MSLTSILLGLALTLIIVATILRPIWLGAQPLKDESHSARLLSEKAAILQSLHDLEQDLQTGKLSQADYSAQRPQLLARGAEILKKIEGK